MARSAQDVVGFRRIFVLFCTLVLVPAMLVSGFGVVAIGNERSAQKQRQRERAEVELLRAERRVAAALAKSRQGLPPIEVLKAAAKGRGAAEGLEVLLAARSEDRRHTPGAIELVEGFVATGSLSGDDEESRARITSTVLLAPLDDYELVVLGGEPAFTTVIVYIVLLSLFYVLLIVGVVLTSRLIWQEARLSRLKTDFVSHVSHELRTPLTSIRMFIETLRLGRAASPEEQEECLELLGKETERLSEMIERVLGYARLKSGRRIFNLEPVEVQTLIEESLAAFRAQQVGKQGEISEIHTELEDGLPPVLCDREALVEALLNLLQNARKYGGAAAHIRVFARQGRRRVIIGVEDDGPGLPKSEHGRIFDRFYQAGAGLLARQSKGSGLGLAITKGIVEGNRGKIHVESEEGRGATFLIDLRMAPDMRLGAEGA